jgi:PQQ-like domain
MMRTHPLTGLLYFVGLVLAALAASGAGGGQESGKVRPLEQKWRRPILMDKDELTGEVFPGKNAKVWVDKALAARIDAALVPGLRPLVIGNLLVLRTYDDARVLALAEDKTVNGTTAGGIFWVGTPAYRGLVAVLDREPGVRAPLTNWLARLPQADLPKAIVENAMSGAISHDGKRVFWVDNFTVPNPDFLMPPPLQMAPKAIVTDQESYELHLLQKDNSLWANDLGSGRIVWRTGEELPGQKDPFARSHFLGAPCHTGGELYVLNETNGGELRLLVLTPATGAVKTTLALDSVAKPNRFTTDARRQVHAAQVVADPSLVICVPHAGKVFGVDPVKQTVRWTYDYGIVTRGDGTLGFWKDSAPILHDGKAVFTAADNEKVHCLNQHDGRLLWESRPPDGLYVAGVVGDKVVVVCNSCCRALSLKDGKEV